MWQSSEDLKGASEILSEYKLWHYL
jgi:hypothetical protein